MTTRTRSRACRTAITGMAVALAAVHSSSSFGQQPEQPAYPQQQMPDVYAQQPVQPAYAPQAPVPGPQPQNSPGVLRHMFAGTIAAVIQGVGGGFTAGLANSVNGAILNWFDKSKRKQRGSANQAAQSGGQSAPYDYGTVPQQDPYSTQPAYPGAGQNAPYDYGTVPQQDSYSTQPAYPGAGQNAPYDYGTVPQQDPHATQPAYPGTGQNVPYDTGTAPQQDPYTAQPGYPTATQTPTYDYGTSPQQDPYASQSAMAVAGAGGGYAGAGEQVPLYAGLAYEVHALGTGGTTTPIDPTTHTFGTGERFVVYYRPTLPGRMTVHNINPLGQHRQIDAINVAAGELATLGPYEFRDYKGSEVLRLSLAPCRTDELFYATRDIVKVSDARPADGLNLSDCNAPATRSARVQTRDIVKVGVDGSTSFALDPVSPQELASGQLAPREVSIVLQHR